MTDLNQLRENAAKLASQYNVSNRDIHEKNSPIYIATTGNAKDAMKLYKNINTALAVGGMGIYGYELALNGAKIIDLFDINELQKLYYDIVNATIIHLEYEDLINHFTLRHLKNKNDNIKDLISFELYEKVRDYLQYETKYVYDYLYKNFQSQDLFLSSLYRAEYLLETEYLKKFASFYNKEEFYKLQKILKNKECEINYHCISLQNLPEAMNKKYDLIVLGNILQYYQSMEYLNTPERVKKFIANSLSNLLTQNGKIQVNYGFETATNAVKKELGIPYEKEYKDKLSQFVDERTIEKEMKTGINIPLIKENNYTYDFIPGVESYEGNETENLILTYHK